jgi:hypothetical protein
MSAAAEVKSKAGEQSAADIRAIINIVCEHVLSVTSWLRKWSLHLGRSVYVGSIICTY